MWKIFSQLNINIHAELNDMLYNVLSNDDYIMFYIVIVSNYYTKHYIGINYIKHYIVIVSNYYQLMTISLFIE